MMSGNYSTVANQNADGSVPPVPDPPGQVSVKLNDSTLHTFPPSTPQGKIFGGSGPPREADVSFSRPISGSSERPPPPGWLKAFTVAAYQPYFDVDTSDILDRIKESLLPLKGTFNDKIATTPELYGPFWICTTLIFVSASIGTCVTYLAHKLHHLEDYDIHLLTWSATVLYCYIILVPIILYIILNYLSSPLGLVQLLCLYGYSLFIFIPAVFLSIIPVEEFRWVVTCVAGLMSAMFIASNLKTHLSSAGQRRFEIVAGVFLLQFALSILLKLYLFK